MSFKVLSSFCLIQITIYNLTIDSLNKYGPENSAPEVRIVKPHDLSGFQRNSIIPYTIIVSDQEDGKSEFDEILDSEVLLEVTYLSDPSLLAKYLNRRSNSDRQMLRVLSRANCFNCHTAKTKLIGPSFDLIADRYASQPQSIENLANKLITGSTGVWGDIPMPAHPDLDIAKAKTMVSWILSTGANSNYSFYIGTEGSIKTVEREDQHNKGIYVLTASYKDRGIEGLPESSKEGQHTVILQIKK